MSVVNHAIRLLPGTDLKAEIEKFALKNNIKAGWIVTCVGSLTRFCLRFANQKSSSVTEGHFEILSLVGTVSVNGCHLHISIGDQAGSVQGGHLLQGCTIYTTAEVVIASAEEIIFRRELDVETGWKELKIDLANEN